MCKRSEETLFPAFITSRNGAKRDKHRENQPRQPLVVGRGEKSIDRLFYTVTKQMSIRRGVAGAKCLAIRHGIMFLNPKPSREPQHLHHQTSRTEPRGLICKPKKSLLGRKRRSLRIAKSERTVRVRAFANAKRAWTM